MPTRSAQRRWSFLVETRLPSSRRDVSGLVCTWWPMCTTGCLACVAFSWSGLASYELALGQAVSISRVASANERPFLRAVEVNRAAAA
jgi:hypothetical protein